MSDPHQTEWTPPPPPPPPPPAYSPSPSLRGGVVLAPTGDMGRAAVFGSAAAAVGGLVWYLAVVVAHRQFVFLAIGVGLLIGVGTLYGARRPGRSVGVLAASIAFVAMVITHYFIDRWVLVDAIKAQGLPGHVPIWLGLSQSFDLMRTVASDQLSQVAFSLLAVGAAGFKGYKGR